MRKSLSGVFIALSVIPLACTTTTDLVVLGGDGGVDASVSDGSATDAARDSGGDGSVGVTDPAPGRTVPGAYTCPGCPTGRTTQFDVNAGNDTSRAFTGTVTGATGNGTFYVIKGGDAGGAQEVAGPVPTESSGNYDVRIPLFCGEQLVKLVWTNAAGAYVEVSRVVRESCAEADVRVTLTWDALGRDWELHLIKPGGRINDPDRTNNADKTDCTWTTCISQSPDWGIKGDPSDDPKKDVDNTGAYGPENIILSKPENGTYFVMVEHWNGNGGADSVGQATLNVRGRTTVIPSPKLAPYRVWTVATIDWPTGVVTPVTDAPFDCSASWAGGCTAPIPNP